MYAHDGILIETEAIARTAGTGITVIIWIEDGEHEVVVGMAIPAPVDVEQAVTVVAVDDKGVASSHRRSAIQDGPSGSQFVVHQRLPRVTGKVLTVDNTSRLVITKIVLQRIHQ